MKHRLIIILLTIAQFVMVLDSTVMNVSISTVAKDLHTTISGLQAAITLYALTMAALMLTGSKLGDKWGRLGAFRVGSIIYGLGSLITAIAPNLVILIIGWSVIEGLGAIFVIPAIAALAAVNYSGRERIVAYSILGAVSGLAAAVGPLIGGLITTYFSWRYVFAAETIVMLCLISQTNKIHDIKIGKPATIDILSSVSSALGMSLLVFGILQSKTWGWINPLASPVIDGREIAPLGISLVAYFILAGIAVLWYFVRRQNISLRRQMDPLLKISLLRIPILRSGLTTLLSQYFAIAAIFFVIPVYLQTILGYDPLKTGLKLLPLSIGLLIFSIVGSRLSGTRSARRITRAGQVAIATGVLFLMGSVSSELRNAMFWIGMLFVGSGFGLMASQLGNVTMSSVNQKDTTEVGGLQGTFQNLGTSLGTAIVGSVFILMLTSGFTSSVQNSTGLSSNAKSAITAQSESGVQIVSPAQAEQYVVKHGGNTATAQTISGLYKNSQLQSLKDGLFVVFVTVLLSVLLSTNLPAISPAKT